MSIMRAASLLSIASAALFTLFICAPLAAQSEGGSSCSGFNCPDEHDVDVDAGPIIARRVSMARHFQKAGVELVESWVLTHSAGVAKRVNQWHILANRFNEENHDLSYLQQGVWYSNDSTTLLSKYEVRMHAIGLAAESISKACPAAIPHFLRAAKVADNAFHVEDDINIVANDSRSMRKGTEELAQCAKH